jgi:hypothetical protein
MKSIGMLLYLAFGLGLGWVANAGVQPGLASQSDPNGYKLLGANDIDGRKKQYVGRVLIQATLIFSAEFFDSMTPKEKDAMASNGSRIEGDQLIMPASPLSGYVVRLGNQVEFIDKNGFFSFDAIPPGIGEGQIYAQLSDIKPFLSFPVTKLVKNSGDEIEPIIFRVKDAVDKVLKKMDE